MEVKLDSNYRDVILLGYENEENLGLRYIASYLIENGVSVGIIPLQDLDRDKLPESILSINPKILGFSLIFQRMLPEFSDIINLLRINGVECHITMGGHFPTIEYEKTLDLIPGLDSIIRHEGELTLLELYKYLDAPDHWLEIRGLAFRNGRHIQKTISRPLIQDLDRLPFPLRSSKIQSHRGLGISSIISSRGCYHNCSFCSIQEFYREAPGPKRRTRSPENVVKEMKVLFDNGTRIFSFKDDDFSMIGPSRQQWIKRFVSNLENAHLTDKILWRISCRVDEIDSDMLDLLFSSGLRTLYLGIESGNNQGLKTCNKHVTVPDIFKSINVLKKSMVNFEYGFMMLDPDSDMSSVKENISFLRRLCDDGSAVVHFAKMAPYGGTSISHRLKKEGRLLGSIIAPDYMYNDTRVDAFETFIIRAFYHMLFHPEGIVSKLQYAKFDATVAAMFFKDEYDTEKYTNEVRRLIRLCNNSTLKTLEQAAKFMECRSPEEIYRDWPDMGKLADQTRAVQSKISMDLDNLKIM